jgi:hypothetical protein
MAPILNFQCKKCRKVFNCDVGSVEVDEKTFRPVFGNKIVCPGCDELSPEDVFLTELGQSQLTDATLDFDMDELDFDDFDDEDDLFGDMQGVCNGCDCFLPVNDLGLCNECAAKMDRDLIRQRDWNYAVAAYGLDAGKREELRKSVIAKYGANHELISPPGAKKKIKKKPGKKRKKGKR